MPRGAITHVEIPSDDPERAQRFYAAVAGWDFEALDGSPGYFMFRTGERSGGAIGLRGTTTGSVVRVYITVDSLEDGIAAAEANGGRVVVEPVDIPGMGRYAAVHDTEGNEVGLWEDASGS